MKKQTILKIILWLIVIATLIGIFCFSAQNSDSSNETSGSFARMIFGIFPFFKNMEPAAQDALIETFMTVVRKIAHFSIYAFLGFWLRFLVRQYTQKYTVLLSAVFSALYAITDEIHQLFVPGRSGQLKDVLIDTSGAIVGAAIAFILGFICKKLKNIVRKPV